MAYLDGEQLPLKTSILRKAIGQSVRYTLHRDYESRLGGTSYCVHAGIIGDVRGRNIYIGDDWRYFTEIKEIVLA